MISTFRNVVLCLDWSNLFFRSLYMANGFGKSVSYDSQEEINNFIAKMAQDIAFILRMFGPNKVIFATDSKHSWRKDIYADYKSNRDKGTTYNWDNIFAALESFKEHLKSLGFLFAETPHAEADDLMALVKELVFEDEAFDDCNLILVSADADIRQLIDFDKEKERYCFVFNEVGRGPGGKRHLYCDYEGWNWYNKPAEMNDIFNMGIDLNKNYIKSILEANKNVAFEQTDPAGILLCKIFCGDDGDCVPSFWDWYKNGKKVRITNRYYTGILSNLAIVDIDDLDKKKEGLQDVMEKVTKQKITDIDVLARLERQKKLVQLSSKMFPKDIAEYKEKIKWALLEQKPLSLHGLKMNDLIKGSEFSQVLVKDKRQNAEIYNTLGGLEKYVEGIGIQAPLW